MKNHEERQILHVFSLPNQKHYIAHSHKCGVWPSFPFALGGQQNLCKLVFLFYVVVGSFWHDW